LVLLGFVFLQPLRSLLGFIRVRVSAASAFAPWFY
jgi:hypothetical protein